MKHELNAYILIPTLAVLHNFFLTLVCMLFLASMQSYSVTHQLSTTTYYRPVDCINYGPAISKQLCSFTDAQVKEIVYYGLSGCFFALFSVLTVQWKGIK